MESRQLNEVEHATLWRLLIGPDTWPIARATEERANMREEVRFNLREDVEFGDRVRARLRLCICVCAFLFFYVNCMTLSFDARLSEFGFDSF